MASDSDNKPSDAKIDPQALQRLSHFLNVVRAATASTPETSNRSAVNPKEIMRAIAIHKYKVQREKFQNPIHEEEEDSIFHDEHTALSVATTDTENGDDDIGNDDEFDVA